MRKIKAYSKELAQCYRINMEILEKNSDST